MLTITKLRGAEYLLSSVADGVEDYFMGAGEAPGVWHGRWAGTLGLDGVVEADALRALVEGEHPSTGAPLLAGHKERTVKALDLTFSAPKSVSLLWAFADSATTAEVSIAVSTAATQALAFLESRAAVTRRQVDGVRRQVPTRGFAVAAFTHRTSRAGDPQLHVHCLVPNLVERDDGTHVAIDAGPIHTWLKASGTVFQAELQRQLTDRLGVTWNPERNGTRELVGFTKDQLRRFSKRTAAIEAALEAGPEAVTAKGRMRADDRASLATRQRKDRSLTPEVLRERWEDEAARAGIPTGARLVRTVRHETSPDRPVTRDEVFAVLVDPEVGLCATRARFGHAHVVERVAALSAGRWTTGEIEATARDFLASRLVVRLSPSSDDAGRRRPPEWSTLEHRQLEDRLLAGLAHLQHRSTDPIPGPPVSTVLLGDDQLAAVDTLTGGGGGALRVVLAAAGHGKTALTAAAADRARAVGRPVVALAATNKAAAELRAAGLDASTIARWRLDGAPLAPGTIVVLDEVSQVATRDAAAVVDAVIATPGAQLWCLGDTDQGRPVAPGGLAAELDRLARQGAVAAAELTTNRRQLDPAERDALAAYRAGDLAASQATRAARGWEHTLDDRDELAAAAAADIARLGAEDVAVLAVSHADCEDLADRIRRHLGIGAGAALVGPGWGPTDRHYTAGDRVLLHLNTRVDGDRVHNGSTGTVTHVGLAGLGVDLDDGRAVTLPLHVVTGARSDGTPSLSHAWARTIDGAQGGTWEQVHLLATPNVDRHTLYVGQSRGRRPTHTWNTVAPEFAEPHGNVVRDRRAPDEQVLAAARRVPDVDLAARADPYVREGELLAERAEHEAALAAGPPDLSRRHRGLRARVGQAERDVAHARHRIEQLDRGLDATSGLHRLRGANRQDRRTLQHHRHEAVARLHALEDQLASTRADLDRTAETVRRQTTWADVNRWRHGEIAGIDHQLGLHWAHTILAAINDGDPLAYGLHRLRNTRGFLATAPGANRRDLTTVDTALAECRAERLGAIAAGEPPPRHLTELLGPAPARGATRDVWLALAERAEHRIDIGVALPGAGDDLLARLDALTSDDPLHRARALIAAADHLPQPLGPDSPERWRATLEDATTIHRTLEHQRTVDLDLGMSL